MNANWFQRKGIFYRPISVAGWLIFSATIGYSIYLFIDIDSRSHSVSDTLINWSFNTLLVVVVYSLIGFLTKKKPLHHRGSNFKFPFSI